MNLLHSVRSSLEWLNLNRTGPWQNWRIRKNQSGTIFLLSSEILNFLIYLNHNSKRICLKWLVHFRHWFWLLYCIYLLFICLLLLLEKKNVWSGDQQGVWPDPTKVSAINALNPPENDKNKSQLQLETAVDEQPKVMKRYAENRWPQHVTHVHNNTQEYFPERNQSMMSWKPGGTRIVIPVSVRSGKHDGHQGLNQCRMRANTSVWWPEIASQITQ